MALTCIKMGIGCLLLGAAFSFPSLPVRADAADDLAAAREAAQRGNLKPLDAWRNRNRGHALEAYATFWMLSGSVDRADPAEVRAFLARHSDSPLADLLRREWLRVLGAAASWDMFRAEYPRLVADDAELA